MSNFFSLSSDGKGKIMYFNHEIRGQILTGDNKEDYQLEITC